jgi:hypothetical protein
MRARLPELDRAATSPEGPLLPSLIAGGHLCLEEVEPEVPMGRNPQVPLAHRGEDGGLHDGVGVEVVQLHLVVVEEDPDESVGGRSEPPI